MTDKDGKKLKIGSLVAIRKAGRESYTMKGKIHSEDAGGFMITTDYGMHWAAVPQIKRITYSGKPKKKKIQWKF